MDFVKVSKIQMYFWFACSGVTLILVSILYFQNSLESVYFFLPVLCVLLGLLRRWQYNKLKKSAAERDAAIAAEKGKKKKH